MFGSNRVLSILVCFLLFTCCFAAPTPATLVGRQNPSEDGPQTVTTTEQIPSQAGMFTQTCTIVMTPITGANGEILVREEKTCTISLGGGGLSSTLMTTTVPASSLPTITLTSSSTTSGGAGSSSTGIGPISTLSFLTPSPTQSGGPNKPSPSSSGSRPSPSGTVAGAAADNSPTPTAFDPPGKKLEVLPIGLGVFAGVSVIAIITVGYVTYERTKHRKNFRQQKLAEAGAEIAYGGMARP